MASPFLAPLSTAPTVGTPFAFQQTQAPARGRVSGSAATPQAKDDSMNPLGNALGRYGANKLLGSGAGALGTGAGATSDLSAFGLGGADLAPFVGPTGNLAAGSTAALPGLGGAGSTAALGGTVVGDAGAAGAGAAGASGAAGAGGALAAAGPFAALAAVLAGIGIGIHKDTKERGHEKANERDDAYWAKMADVKAQEAADQQAFNNRVFQPRVRKG